LGGTRCTLKSVPISGGGGGGGKQSLHTAETELETIKIELKRLKACGKYKERMLTNFTEELNAEKLGMSDSEQLQDQLASLTSMVATEILLNVKKRKFFGNLEIKRNDCSKSKTSRR